MRKIDIVLLESLNGLDQTLNYMEREDPYSEGYITGVLGAITEILGDLDAEGFDVEESKKSLENLRDFYDIW
jgi:hypothetical protein